MHKVFHMKRSILLLLVLSFFSAVNAQILNPVIFNYSVVKKGNDLYELRVKATLEPKWHIYSVNNPDGGAQATEIKINDGKVVGTVKEIGKLKTTFEKVFGINQNYFESTVDFVQLVKLKPGEKKITGTVNYMVCNDRLCLPPKEIEFKVKM